MADYYLSKLADKDIGNIASYTIQRFGIRQARLYRDGLFKAFEMVYDFPFMGVGINCSLEVIQLNIIYLAYRAKCICAT